MLDTINLERRGIPAAVVGHDRLLNTTGKGMAVAQGYRSLKFAVLPHSSDEWSGPATVDEIKAIAAAVAPQVERIFKGDAQ